MIIALLQSVVAGTADAVLWRDGLPGQCEPPASFYGNAHQAGQPPCCATQPGVCPGGAACPPGGVCPGTGTPCLPATGKSRPNVVLIIADDQGACHYGSAGECRSVQSGTPIPAPSTPNLDVLAGHGTVFPIAHNTAAWCYPSLNSILTGRYQRSIDGTRNLSDNFVTIPGALRALVGEPGAVQDPFEPDDVVGGYCTFLGGKFTGAGGKTAFDAQSRVGERRLGKLDCVAGPGGAPRCGSENAGTPDPLRLPELEDLIEFIDDTFYPVPTRPGALTNQPFFAWYAPRIPHAPLRAPEPVVAHLFGSDAAGMGGLLNLGALCQGANCPPTVQAFRESNIGNQREFYSSIWWVDDNIREIRKYLARKSAPHCIQRSGRTRFSATNAAACVGGTWATEFLPPADGNTILMYISDNGWFLPDSKHSFSENGYRTRLHIYDPRAANPAPPWNPADAAKLPANESAQLAHSTDLLPTILGYALDTPAGSQVCPAGKGQGECDGRDLRAHLRGAPGGPPAAPLRRALCGHHTERGTAPTRQRYLLTRPGSVGRCVDQTLPACDGAATCAAGESCIGGRCTRIAAVACGTTAQCPKGSACLGGVCRAGPPCLDDVSCIGVFSSFNVRCAAPEQRWCRNAPNQACSTAADCPACPGGPGDACGRVCEAQQLKLYLERNADQPELVDLFRDPDERGRDVTNDPLVRDMSSPAGPYQYDLRRLSCCLDDWWPEVRTGASLCAGGFACPADFVCNR